MQRFTVGDFHRHNSTLGSQGTLLVPRFYYKLFMHPYKRLLVLNIVILANISMLATDYPASDYDTMPGNMLLDA
ncbi:MAG: anhydro-N-acetylmuramic acid kinase [Candidatus Malihini olakiniferum]